MLDYQTSRRRMLIALALVLMALSIIPAMTARQLTTSEGRNEYSGQMQAVGAAKAPELIVHTEAGVIRCPIVRCRYEAWRDDVGKHIQVVVDSQRSLVEIKVAGEIRFNADDVRKRWLSYVSVAAFALLVGGLLLIVGIRKK
jgi:hypothetical protein